MFRRTAKSQNKRSSAGQNMVEYVLVVVGVVIALIATLGPSGFLSRKIDETMNLTMVGTKCVALQTCFDPEGCPSVCGNGCCEPGESVATCASDCSLCFSDADCDDGVACNGVETCDSASGCQPGTSVCRTCRGPDGATFADGECKEYYARASVSYGSDCGTPQERCCDGVTGRLSGSYSAPSCSVQSPRNCTISPGTLSHGQTAKLYKTSSVPCGEPCEWEMNGCDNGSLTYPAYRFATCGETCRDCIDPAGGSMIANGTTRAFARVRQEECWTVCESQDRLCDNGTLLPEGSEYIYHFNECVVATCDDGIYCTEDKCIPNRETDFGCVHHPRHERCDDGFTCTGSETDRTGEEIWRGGELYNPPETGGEVVVYGPAEGEDWCDPLNDCQFEPVHERCLDEATCSEDYCAPVYNFPNYEDQVPLIGSLEDCGAGYNVAECEKDLEYDETGCWYYLNHDPGCSDGVDCTKDWCDPQGQDPDPEDLSPPIMFSGLDYPGTGCWHEGDNNFCFAEESPNLACTIDWCHLTDNCQHEPVHSACNDFQDCTRADSGGNQYTDPEGFPYPWAPGEDYCDVKTGCVWTPHDDQCLDTIDCTDDVCDVRGDPVTLRNMRNGCNHTPNNSKCDDFTACTYHPRLLTDYCNVLDGCHYPKRNEYCSATYGSAGACMRWNCVSGSPAPGGCETLATCAVGDNCCNDMCCSALCCSGSCQECCGDSDCDDGDPCTAESCNSGSCEQTGFLCNNDCPAQVFKAGDGLLKNCPPMKHGECGNCSPQAGWTACVTCNNGLFYELWPNTPAGCTAVSCPSLFGP